MDLFSMEDLFFAPLDDDSPGAQLYLYRLLHLLASREPFSSRSTPLSYLAAKKLSSRIGIQTADNLRKLFANVGLGTLEMDVTTDRIRATITHPATEKLPTLTKGSESTGTEPGCTLEHGLIDGVLEVLTDMPIITAETRCWTRGDKSCVFEAVRDQKLEGGYLPAGNTGTFEQSAALSGKINLFGLPSGRAPSDFPTKRKHHEMRAWYLDLTGRELAKAKRHGRQLSVLYVDLDGLGQVNISHGRTAGDQIISAVAMALSRSCRAEDYIWHHGDDEFAVVLSETGAGKAEVVARRLTTEIRSAAEFVEVSATVSASIGYSTFPNNAGNVDDLFSSARAALHLAKSMGRGKAQSATNLRGDVEQTIPGKKGFPSDETPLISPDRRHDAHIYEKDRISPASETDEISVRDEGMEAPKASIVVASSSPLLLAGMRDLLSGYRDAEVVGNIDDPGRFSPIIDDMRPDLIFSDLEMAAANDFAILRTIETGNLPVKLVVSANEVDQDVIKMAVDFSVDGIVMQNSNPKEIITALESVYRGKTVYPEEVQSAIRQLESNRRLLGELSEREIEVLRLVADGKSNSQISDDLFITVNTVRFHLANIYQKLSVSNRTEAANYFLRQDINSEGQTKLL